MREGGKGMEKSNIILVGFMGTGKTAAGKTVARRLKRAFIDMDAVIEERSGMPISEIFRRHGEAHFRQLERDLVQELSARENLVVAAGGGVVLNPDNLSDFGRTGVVICLRASPEIILRRVSPERHRPLLEGAEKGRRILELLQSRQRFYSAVANQIDTTYHTPDMTADQVIEMFERIQREETDSGA